MIKKIDFEISVKDMPKVQKTLLQDKEDVVINEIVQTLSGKRKEITGKDWRLIYDDGKVIALIEGAGVTVTLAKASEHLTKEMALAEIELLRLDDSALHPIIEEGNGKVEIK